VSIHLELANLTWSLPPQEISSETASQAVIGHLYLLLVDPTHPLMWTRSSGHGWPRHTLLASSVTSMTGSVARIHKSICKSVQLTPFQLGDPFTIQASSNLSTWTPLTKVEMRPFYLQGFESLNVWGRVTEVLNNAIARPNAKMLFLSPLNRPANA